MKSVWRITESDNLGRADNGAVDVGPNHTIPYYYVGPNRPLFAELLPCAVSTTCSALSLVNRLLGMPGLRPSRWWWQEVFKRKYSIVHIMSENGLNVIDLVLTHLNHPWGPPWTLATIVDPWRPLATLGDPWRPLATLGDPWRPLATLGDMLENDQFPPKWHGWLRERSSI